MLQPLQHSLPGALSSSPHRFPTMPACMRFHPGSWLAPASKPQTLPKVCLVTTCPLEFAGFLRFDELVHLRSCDIKIDGSMAKLKTRWSKMNQFQNGDKVLIPRSGGHICPGAIMEKYMAKAGVSSSSSYAYSGRLQEQLEGRCSERQSP